MLWLDKLKAFLYKKWKYILTLVILSIVLYFVFFLIMWNISIQGACDAFFINGALFIGLGILQFVVNAGTFDLLSFSTAKWRDSYKRDHKFEEGFDILDYKESKKNKRYNNRFNILIYEIIGIFYIIGAILTILFI